jgi:hypothetical protein
MNFVACIVIGRKKKRRKGKTWIRKESENTHQDSMQFEREKRRKTMNHIHER